MATHRPLVWLPACHRNLDLAAGKTPAELVMYAGENHGFLGQGTPSVREDAAERVVDWLERHIGRPPAPMRPREREENASLDQASA